MKQHSKNKIAAETLTAAGIATIKGKKGITKFIEEITASFEKSRQAFRNDLNQPEANLNEKDEVFFISHGSGFEFKVHMAAVAHRGMVHHITLCHPSELVTAEIDVTQSIAQLQEILKMFINNKQQKTTTINQIRRILRNSTTTSVVFNDGDDDALLLERPPSRVALDTTLTSFLTSELNELIETTKRNHRTISRKILEQARFNMHLTKSRVLAYKSAADTTIGKIIHHADCCRKFVLRCNDLALVEFCASVWWFKSQNDDLSDQSDYSVSIVDVDATRDEANLDAMLMTSLHNRYTSFSELTPESITTSSTIQIFVYGPYSSANPNPLVAKYDLDQELAETILTDEAVRLFRREKCRLWNQSKGRYLSQSQEQEESVVRIQEVHAWGLLCHVVVIEDDNRDPE